MQIQNKRTGVISNITADEWMKMEEVQLQKYFNVLSREDITVKENLKIENFLNPEKKTVEIAVAEMPKKKKTNK